MFLQPRNDRDWETDQKILPDIIFKDQEIEIKNIRNFFYRSENNYDSAYYTQAFKSEEVTEGHIGIVPFSRNPFIVHMLIKFAFQNKEHIVFSIEVRKRKNQKFVAWKTIFNQYEIMYVIANQNDVIDLRNNHRKNEPVHMYRLNLSKEQVKTLFLDMCRRSKKLKDNPEFFNLFFNSCSSNLITHLNYASTWPIPFYYKYFAPGLLKRYLLNKGFISA